MDVAMAPPHKRRKLTDSTSDTTSLSDNSTALPENSPPFAHAVQSLSTQPAVTPPWPTPSGTTEQTTRMPLPAVGGIQDYNVLVARQGTLLSSVDSVDSAVNSVISGVTSLVSASESISISISASISVPTNPISIDTSSTTTEGASASNTSNTSLTPTASTSSTISDTPITSTTSTTSFSSTESLPSDLSALSSTISTPSGNSTSTYSIASTSSTTELTAFSANLTTSASVSATSSRTTSTRTGSTSIDFGLFFVATLTNGDVSTISRQPNAFTTTLTDGEVFTIPSVLASSSRSSSRTTSSLSEITPTSLSASSSIDVNTVTAITTVGGAGSDAGGTASYAAPTTSTTSSSTAGNGGNDDSTPPAGTIAGGVVGGAAGLAVVLLIAMLFVRWYRRKGQMSHQALPPGPIDSPDGDGATAISREPGMAERAGLMPMMAALPAFFRHQNRSTEGSEPSERGFTRVSGRKLPSAFSGGMTSEAMSNRPPPQMPLRGPETDSDLQETSFYRDSEGYYGGAGVAARSGSVASDEPMHGGPELMTMSPGPQRQPQIHAGGPYTMSPTTSDNPTSPSGTAATFNRSETYSRFTEDM